MKEKHNVTLYSCDFCNRKMQIKKAMIRHEKVCTKNPENYIACSDCKHCEATTKQFHYQNHYYGDCYKEVKSFKCNALDKIMYPPKIEKTVIDFPENFEDEIVMPSKCEYQNSNLPF